MNTPISSTLSPNTVYSVAVAQRLAARALIERGLKPSLTKAITLVPQSEIRRLWLEKTGEKPKPGKTPESVMHFISSDLDSLAITFAALVYRNLSDPSSRYQVDTWGMISAFELCRQMVPSLRMDALFYIARDFKMREYHFLQCNKCGSPYMSHNADSTLIHCPHCTLTGHLTLTTIKTQAAKSRDSRTNVALKPDHATSTAVESPN